MGDISTQSTEIAIDRLSPEQVTDLQIADFLGRLEEGESVAAAAHAVGLHRRTGYRVLSRYRANLEGIQKLLQVKAYQAAENWIEASTVAASKGDHRPAKEWLQTIKAVDPIDAGAHAGANVTIIIGTPDAPIRVFPQEKAIPATTSSDIDLKP